MVVPERAAARLAAQDRLGPQQLGRVEVELVVDRPEALRASVILQCGGKSNDVERTLESGAKPEIENCGIGRRRGNGDPRFENRYRFWQQSDWHGFHHVTLGVT